MESKWCKSETRNGIPYYINNVDEITQWDHPELVSAVSSLNVLDNIHYGAYRTAAKLRKLQKTLHMDVVNLITVRMAFELHGYSRHNDSVMDAQQLYDIISEMYHMTKVRGRSTLHVGRCSDLMLNWLLNLYDVQRTGCIRVLPVKLGIATLCAGRITEKYRYFQDLLTDRTGRITRKMMTEFMRDMTQITDMLGESTTFGKGVATSVEDCFQSALGPNIAQDDFVQWLLSEPQTLVWLPTLHRFSAAETMKHEAKCATCKAHPIIGLRYQCLKCFNYDLCQDCFFTRRTSKQHKLNHPIQEYCLSSKSKEDVRAFTKTIRNNLSKKHGRRIKRKYRPIGDGWETEEDAASDARDAELETHVRLSQMSEKLKAAEAQLPPDIVALPRDHGSSHAPSVKSARPSVATATTDDSRYLEKRELEDLIDALERENDELMEDLEKMGLPCQDSSPSSSDSSDSSQSSQDQRPRRHKQRQQRRRGTGSRDRTAVLDQRNEAYARYEVLEEHNKRLEDQLRKVKGMVGKDRDTYPRDGHSRQSATSHGINPTSDNFPHFLSLPPDPTSRLSNQSSGYQATSSGFDQTAERPPPYGQSHPALDTIADQSSPSSTLSSSKMPRFVMMGGGDYVDGLVRGVGTTGVQGTSHIGLNLPHTGLNHPHTGLNLPHAGLNLPRTGLNVPQQNGIPSQQRMADLMANIQANAPQPPAYHDSIVASSLQPHGYNPLTEAQPLYQGSAGHSLSQQVGHEINQRNAAAAMTLGTPTNQSHPGSLIQIDQSHPQSIPINQSQTTGLLMAQSHLSGHMSSQTHPSAHSQRSNSSGHPSIQTHPTTQVHFDERSILPGSDFNRTRPTNFHMDKSRALESVLDLDHFLPHLADQSTVHFPVTAASVAYPSEEAELDELMQRLTEAFPNFDSPPASEPEEPTVTLEAFLEPKPRSRRRARRGSGDLFSAAGRIGQAMSGLVTRASIGDER